MLKLMPCRNITHFVGKLLCFKCMFNARPFFFAFAIRAYKQYWRSQFATEIAKQFRELDSFLDSRISLKDKRNVEIRYYHPINICKMKDILVNVGNIGFQTSEPKYQKPATVINAWISDENKKAKLGILDIAYECVK